MMEPAEYLAAKASKSKLRVPPYPAVALRVQELVQSPAYTVNELAKVVAADAALAFRILAVANSATYRPSSGAVTSMDLAISRLGSHQVSELALAACLADDACAEGPLVYLRYLAWRRSLTSAFIAQELASIRGVGRGEGLLSGLLGDFGVSVGLSTLEMGISEGQVSSELHPLAYLQVAERFRLKLGRHVARRWGLPSQYAHVLEDVAGEPRGPQSPLALLLRHAMAIARLLESYPVMTDKLLEAVLSDAEERDRLLHHIPSVPGQVAALGAESPPPRSSSARSSRPPMSVAPTSALPLSVAPMSALPLSMAPLSGMSASVSPLSTRSGPRSSRRVAVQIAVQVRKGKERFPAEVELAGPDGLTLRAPSPLEPNWLAELTVIEGERSFSFWVRVGDVQPNGDQFRIEVVPFGLRDQEAARFDALYKGGRASS